MSKTTPIGIFVSMEQYASAYEWCVRTFEPRTVKARQWYVDFQLLYGPEFVFIREQDAALFALKWQ